ncbi:hypothetical protein BU24DRAFT_455619 [Aaosphaeria arxii CBS 175.79]|uniref:HNH nuclease domain-containing protein n=1 Tax=Aaosphaeria arxii CBS 175.79 TaxID=1450172 RepID=A0A6A5X9E7_9PLEO|nr:uncharacterized protein BU24DRAFT_455619 [Aaosphaeria arxii CBS 175.79]KAF2009685.1 hypothetical protein BU24DRAFT_455619 [Aaosphaeria arxii CBS 175.79]
MSSDLLQPRKRYERPSHADGGHSLPINRTYKVYLRHPAYNDSSNILLALPALNHRQGGIHHETARIACAIIANNSWKGYLTETREGAAVDIESDGILCKRDYYFYMSREDTGGMPTEVPLDRLLPRRSSLTQATLIRDISCRITNYIEGTEPAHLIPRSEELWFRANGMSRYTNRQSPDTEPINDTLNVLLLRSDIQDLFDQKLFVVVPKSAQLVVHILAPGSSPELTDLYHNVALQPLVRIAIEYIFARFAWSIFAHCTDFIVQGLERRLVVRKDEGAISVEDFSGEQCLRIFGRGQTSSHPSPRKRSRNISVFRRGGRDRRR